MERLAYGNTGLEISGFYLEVGPPNKVILFVKTLWVHIEGIICLKYTPRRSG